MRRQSPPPPPKMTLLELGQAVKSAAADSPLFGDQVPSMLQDVFRSMVVAGYILSEPRLLHPTLPGHTTWRVDVRNVELGFKGALMFNVPILH